MRAIALSLLLALGACSSLSNPVSIATAVTALQGQLHTAGALSVAGAGAWSAAETAAFDSAVHQQQCYAGNPDPVVPVLASSITIALSGSISGTGTFSVSALTTAPLFGLSASATKAQGQTVSVPITLTPLSNLPSLELSQQLGYEAALLGATAEGSDGATGSTDAAALGEKGALLAARDALRAHIGALEAGFDAHGCASTSTPAGPIVTLQRRI